jgi:hypothetical protein
MGDVSGPARPPTARAVHSDPLDPIGEPAGKGGGTTGVHHDGEHARWRARYGPAPVTGGVHVGLAGHRSAPGPGPPSATTGPVQVRPALKGTMRRQTFEAAAFPSISSVQQCRKKCCETDRLPILGAIAKRRPSIGDGRSVSQQMADQRAPSRERPAVPCSLFC